MAKLFFTTINNNLRQDQDRLNISEGNWGFLIADLRLKDHFRAVEFCCDDGSTHAFAGVVLTIPEPSPENPELAAFGYGRAARS